MRMNPTIRARWVAALRSGKFPQAHSYLNVPGEGFCCLGVLCEIAAYEGVVQRQVTFGDENEDVVMYVSQDEGDDKVLPAPVAVWAGIVEVGTETGVLYPESNPKVKLGDLHGETFDRSLSLIDLNDSYEWSFEQIADAIEADQDAQS